MYRLMQGPDLMNFFILELTIVVLNPIFIPAMSNFQLNVIKLFALAKAASQPSPKPNTLESTACSTDADQTFKGKLGRRPGITVTASLANGSRAKPL